MRQEIKNFISLVADTLLLPGPIYEFGALQVDGQEGFADLRPLFPGQEFVGADMRPGKGVDRVLNLHAIDLPPESVGTIICLDTLEHVEYPYRAMAEIHRVLKPDGIVIISSVMDFPIHDYPYDYWRFTPQAFESLLKPFTHVFVGYVGKKVFPHTVLGVGFKGSAPNLREFHARFAAWKKQAERFKLKGVIKLFVPSSAYPLYHRVYGSPWLARVKRLFALSLALYVSFEGADLMLGDTIVRKG